MARCCLYFVCHVLLCSCLATRIAGKLTASSVCSEVERRIRKAWHLDPLKVPYSMQPITLGEGYRVYRAPTLNGTVSGWSGTKCKEYRLFSHGYTMEIGMTFSKRNGAYKTYVRLPASDESFVDVMLECFGVTVTFTVRVSVNTATRKAQVVDYETVSVKTGIPVYHADEGSGRLQDTEGLFVPVTRKAAEVVCYSLPRDLLVNGTLRDVIKDVIQAGFYRNLPVSPD